MVAISLAEAKARFSEMVARAQAGETVSITKRGKPVARLVAERPAPVGIDIEELRRLTQGMTPQRESAAETIRRARDAARY